MPVAALYDIHGNLPALEAVLDQVRAAGVDRVIVGGDVVPGPMSGDVVAGLLDLELPVQFIQGNGESAVVAQMSGVGTEAIPAAAREVVRWEAEQLDPAHERLFAGWPLTLRLQIPAVGEVLFCHATPRNNTEIFTRLTAESRLAPVFSGLDAAMVVCGHTHMQFDRMVADVRVVNAGSVGMPFGEPGAYWLLLGPGVQLRRTSYDLQAAARRVRGTKYPQAEQFAAKNVLRPPTEAEMLDAFARVELR